MEVAQVRNLAIEFLRRHPSGQLCHGSDSFLARRASELGLVFEPQDAVRFYDVMHDLYREGVLASGHGQPTAIQDHLAWPHYRVTEYGRAVLRTHEYVPHDPTGYLAQFQRDVPDVDPAVVAYLDEALRCYRAGAMLAAAVMTGCAAEKAMLQLIDAVGGAVSDARTKEKFEADTKKQWMIGRKYTVLWKLLELKLATLPESLADDLHTVLDRVFDVIRKTRNDAGHPTGKAVSREIVYTNFQLLPIHVKRVMDLVHYLQANTL